MATGGMRVQFVDRALGRSLLRRALQEIAA